jgi:sugar phosphate isomerase/epimerase
MLAYIDAGQTRLEELESLFDLVSQLGSRLIILAVLEPEVKNPTAEEKVERDELEDRVWKFLYQIEDIAFRREIKISLMLEDGELVQTIASVVKSYEVNLCATFLYKEINVEELHSSIGDVPLLLLNQEGR